MEIDLEINLLKKLLEKYFPEILTQDPNTLSLNGLTHIIHQYFSQKLTDNINDLLESLDVKYADIDTAISILNKHVASMAVMDMRELIIYKVLPCPRGDLCVKKPAEIVPHNEYMDKFLECPFYHHEKDKRRIPVECLEVEEEFAYKASYQKRGDRDLVVETEEGSRNFYESMFHPIFYKLFECKRKYCKGSYLCPFRHSEKEKEQWEERFIKMTGKQREAYLKEKAYSMSIGSTTSVGSHEENLQRAFVDGDV